MVADGSDHQMFVLTWGPRSDWKCMTYNLWIARNQKLGSQRPKLEPNTTGKKISKINPNNILLYA